MTIESLRYWFNVYDSAKTWWLEILLKGSLERYILALERFCEFINSSDVLSRPLWRQGSSRSLLSDFPPPPPSFTINSSLSASFREFRAQVLFANAFEIFIQVQECPIDAGNERTYWLNKVTSSTPQCSIHFAVFRYDVG